MFHFDDYLVMYLFFWFIKLPRGDRKSHAFLTKFQCQTIIINIDTISITRSRNLKPNGKEIRRRFWQ